MHPKFSLQNSRHYRVNKKLIDPEKHFKRPEELKRLTMSNISHGAFPKIINVVSSKLFLKKVLS